MRRRRFIGAICAATLAWPLSLNAQQPASLKDQIIGTWTLVTAVNVEKDGKILSRLGANPKGTFVFEANGRYVHLMMRTDNTQLTARMVASFGTYSVNEADRTLITNIEGSSFPQLNGTSQQRIITSLTADQLAYLNPATTSGRIGETVWVRAK